MAAGLEDLRRLTGVLGMIFGNKAKNSENLWLIFALAAMASVSAGCAASGASSVSSATGVDASAQGKSGARSAADDDAGTTAEVLGVKRECRNDIAEFVRNADGTFGVLTVDKFFYHVGAEGTPRKLRDFPDEASNYTLMPFENIVIHRTKGSVMLEDVATGLELFKLQGDASIDRVWFSLDFEELAIQTVEGRYNVWNTHDRFGGISTGETVQDFLNRQSPDHSLRYPGVVRALALGKAGNVAVVTDDPESGKVGLIYHLDSVNAPGKLAVQGRTNTPVTSVAISPSSRYIAAIDANGDFYLVNTGEKKGFIAFSKLYKNVHGITFWGDHPVVLQGDRTVIVDDKTGTAWREVSERFDTCMASGEMLYCSGDGYLTVVSAQTGKVSKRYAFRGGAVAVVDVENGVVSGDLADTCEK